MSTAAESIPTRHQNLYAHYVWLQQRFFAGFLVAVGVVATAISVYQRNIYSTTFAAFIFYVPVGALVLAALLFYRWRSKVEVSESGVKLSNSVRSVVIPYDSIRSVKALPLRQHFEDGRSRSVAPFMRKHLDEPAVFLKLRGDESQLKEIKSRLGVFKSGLMNEETIAVPVPDADRVVWEISAHLPERTGQNQGGAKRRKRHR
ncbi:MAG TPA: hypothetical protein VFL27_00095 [Candidatus Dormibacteraeota bacterium]|nr:hypothetical protein [Candidatus Dormibacteraeota bacterium]